MVRSDRRRRCRRFHIWTMTGPACGSSPPQEGFSFRQPADHAGGPSFCFLGLSALSITRLAAFIAASLLSDVPDFVPVSVSTDHFQRPLDTLHDSVLDAAMFHAWPTSEVRLGRRERAADDG